MIVEGQKVDLILTNMKQQFCSAALSLQLAYSYYASANRLYSLCQIQTIIMFAFYWTVDGGQAC